MGKCSVKMLSTNFASWEFKCKCCAVIVIDESLIAALQELRGRAREPIRVLSGYRCKYHNEAVGGKINSQHITGKAADITINGWSVREMFLMARSVPEFFNGGIGQYLSKGFIHVDVRGEQARWREL